MCDGLPRESKIACLVVVGEVPKASHPDIARYEDSDGIVNLLGLKVVIQQEQDLQSVKPCFSSESTL